jgi:hypothetical protein
MAATLRIYCVCGNETHKVGENRQTKEINQSIPHAVHGG